MDLTQDRLKEVLVYDQSSGLFFRKLAPSRRHKSTRVVPCGSLNSKGYVTIGVDGKYYKAHRLAWLWVTGSWPLDQIDHIDLNKSNNAWSNLRGADNSQNQANTGPRHHNRAGLKGAHYNKRMNLWTSRIRVRGQRFFLGYFKSPQEANIAYRAASSQFNPEYGRA